MSRYTLLPEIIMVDCSFTIALVLWSLGSHNNIIFYSQGLSLNNPRRNYLVIYSLHLLLCFNQYMQYVRCFIKANKAYKQHSYIIRSMLRNNILIPTWNRDACPMHITASHAQWRCSWIVLINGQSIFFNNKLNCVV